VIAVLLHARARGVSVRVASGLALRLGLAVGLSMFMWRAAGNTPALNDDPMPFVSPNDILCPVITYVVLGLYGDLSGDGRTAGWPATRLILTIVSLVVNIVTI
jgi:hypothetical protein